jgi:hypothetical protein
MYPAPPVTRMVLLIGAFYAAEPNSSAIVDSFTLVTDITQFKKKHRE